VASAGREFLGQEHSVQLLETTVNFNIHKGIPRGVNAF